MNETKWQVTTKDGRALTLLVGSVARGARTIYAVIALLLDNPITLDGVTIVGLDVKRNAGEPLSAAPGVAISRFLARNGEALETAAKL